MPDYSDSAYDGAIAITGMAMRVPGASNPEAFWSMIREGRCALTDFTPEELAGAGVPPAISQHPDYVARGGVLDDVELFDAGFFGFTPLEAACLSPQNRLLFECVWEAIESAGHDPLASSGTTGLFVGQSQDRYWQNFVQPHEGEMDAELAFFSNPDFLATGIAYKLNLRGPAMTVQSFCSTSLLAVHLARQALLEGECDMALAGGTSVRTPQHQGYGYVPDGIFSQDGVVRTFDADANGTLFGNGVGVVTLRRLQDALDDRDPIIAILRGSAANNDGNAKAGYNAPSVEGQARAVARALADAEVSADSIGYVECHGTGTLLGDPIEIAALNRAFRRLTDRTGFCAVGSVKPNVGHLDRASGVSGLIKTALALQHSEIPGVVNFETPNPRIALEDSPFYVARECRPWPTGDEPRRAGVTSLGYGGTNVHVILEEVSSDRADNDAPAARTWPHILVLSARSAASLHVLAGALADHIEAKPEIRLADVAHTLQVGRHAFNHRLVVLASDRAEAVSELRSERAGPETQIRGPQVAIDLTSGTLQPADRDVLLAQSASLEGLLADEGDDLSAALRMMLDGWGFRAGAGQLTDDGAPRVTVVARTDAADNHGKIGLFDGPGETALARLVANLWLAGAVPDWSRLPGATQACRVALPTVRFERSRHWFDPQEAEVTAFQAGPVPRSERPVVLAVPTWRRLSRAAPLTRPDCRIVVVDPFGFGESLADRLESDGETIVRVRHVPDGEVANVADGVYTADLDDDQQIETLLTRLKLWNPGALVSCLSLVKAPAGNDVGPHGARIEAGLKHSLFDPARWLRAVSGVWPDRPFRVDFISCNLFQVTGGDLIHPERAALAPLVRVAAEEYPGLDVRCLETDSQAQRHDTVASLSGDLQLALPALSARRGRQLWVPDIQAEVFEAPVFEERLRPGGAYLVLGGLGGVGWTIACYLARKVDARLAIVGRTMPDPGDGSRAAARLQALVDLAPEVMTAVADVTDKERMAAVLAEMRARFGRIDGVIYAVHGASGVLLEDLTPDTALPTLADKIEAVPVLIDMLGETPPDFLLLCSSMASLEPVRGQIDHAAACAVKDAIAQSGGGGFPVLSVNWCSWRGLGAAHDAWQAASESLPVDHPILHRRELTQGGEVRYCGNLNPDRDWVVAEHILNGEMMLPGAGTIDLILWAYCDYVGHAPEEQAIRLEPITFMAPLTVKQGQPREFAIVFHDTEAGVLVRLESYAPDGAPSVHARTVVQTLTDATVDDDPISLSGGEPVSLPERPCNETLHLGDRWDCLTDLTTDPEGMYLNLELARDFQEDLDKVMIHPAVLDMALSAAVRASDGNVELLFVGCGAFDVHRRPGGKLKAHTYQIDSDPDGTRRVSVRIFDAAGRLAIEARELVFAEPEAAGVALVRFADRLIAEPENPFMADSISPDEGIEILRRLPVGDVAQILVTHGVDAPLPTEMVADAAPRAMPRGERNVMAFLATVWQRVLGLKVEDEHASFFELGGNSLAATRVLSRIRDAFGVTVTLKEFFAGPTLANLGRLVEGKVVVAETHTEEQGSQAQDNGGAAPGPEPESDSSGWETGVL